MADIRHREKGSLAMSELSNHEVILLKNESSGT
jgi:hypothetical protein